MLPKTPSLRTALRKPRQRGLSPPFLLLTLLVIRGTCNSRLRSHWRECSVILFYTASDYYGIHTVFYTPLIIALSSTGATVHKGLLRIVGCIIGGALGLICSIWVIPRFETLETFLLIVFCVHGLAAWIAFGSERISYVGLQIALAFDLGFLQGYGPPTNIDPLRDRFIGIVIGICIITIVFSLVWPESADSSARERLGACLRAIARLLHLSGSNKGSQISSFATGTGRVANNLSSF